VIFRHQNIINLILFFQFVQGNYVSNVTLRDALSNKIIIKRSSSHHRVVKLFFSSQFLFGFLILVFYFRHKGVSCIMWSRKILIKRRVNLYDYKVQIPKKITWTLCNYVFAENSAEIARNVWEFRVRNYMRFEEFL